jgi:integrase
VADHRALPYGTLESTEKGAVIGEISGRDRAMPYRVALTTGFRASELKSLTPESFDSASDPPTVTIEARYSKHRREDVLPLHPEMVPRLQDWLGDLPPLNPMAQRSSRSSVHRSRARGSCGPAQR